MSSTLPSFVLGYHGCDRSVAEAIFSGSSAHLLSSQNEYDWLGHGIYFWENSPQRALNYVRQQISRRARKSQIHEPAIVGAVIDLGNCLNLLDAHYSRVVRAGFTDLQDSIRSSGGSMPVNRTPPGGNEVLIRALDCAVVNIIHARRKEDNLQPFDSVRAAFIEGEPIYEGGGFYEKTHIQVCVRETGKIKGYFRPIVDASS